MLIVDQPMPSLLHFHLIMSYSPPRSDANWHHKTTILEEFLGELHDDTDWRSIYYNILIE